MTTHARLALLLAACAAPACRTPPEVRVAAARALEGRAEDGRRYDLPAGVRIVQGAAPEVRAYAVHGVIRPSVVLAGAGRLRLSVPAGASGLRFAVAVRPVERAANLKVFDARDLQHPLLDDTVRNERDWQERELALPEGTSELELAVDTRAESVALGEIVFERRAPAPEHPNVLVYVVDCLRADHVGAWGYEEPTTPAIDALAAGAVRFENTFSCAGWTKPSTGCLFTSRYPNRHGARTVDDALDPEATPLARRFQAAGYATAAFVANPVLDHQSFGFGRGFDHYVALSLSHRNLSVNSFNTDAADLTRAVLGWVDENRHRRFFVYAHSLDLHAPYAPHAPFDRMSPRGVPGLPQSDLESYDRELAYNDRQLGVLVNELRRAGLYDDTMIVVLADHGEEFGEHGAWRHGKTLFDTLLHIPFLVKLPGGRAAGRRIVDPVVNLDVGPTLLQLAGLEAASDIQGASLAGLVDGGSGPPAREIFAEQMSGRDAVWAVRSRGLKLVRRLLPDPGELFYDTRSDPGESRSLLPSEGPRADPLRTVLDHFVDASLEGFHLRMGGGPPGTRLEAEIAAETEIAPVTRLVIFTGDELEMSPDRRSARVRFTVDEHGPRRFVFGTRPAGAPVRVSLRANGRVLDTRAVALGPGAAPPPAVPFALDAATRGTPRDRKPSGVFAELGYVGRTAAGAEATTDPELLETLRALGYVQ